MHSPQPQPRESRRPVRRGVVVRGAVESFDTTQASVRAEAARDAAYAGVTASRFFTHGRTGCLMARDSESGLVAASGGRAQRRADATLHHGRTSQQIQAPNSSVSTLGTQRRQYAPLDTALGSARLSVVRTEGQTTTLVASRSEIDATLLQGSTLLPVPDVILNCETLDGVDLKHTMFRGATLLPAGPQVLDWNTPTEQSFYEGIPSHEHISGRFLRGEEGLWADRVVIDGGYREDQREMVRSVALFTAVPGLAGGRQLPAVRDRDLRASHYAALGLTRRPGPPALSLTARAYRAEQGALTPVSTGPGVVLRPEQQDKVEAGIGWRPPSIPSSVQLSGFRSQVLNAKLPVTYVRQGLQRIALYDQIDVLREGAALFVRTQAGLAGGLLRGQFG